MAWTGEEITSLRSMRESGSDWLTIAMALGRSPDRCRKKHREMATGIKPKDNFHPPVRMFSEEGDKAQLTITTAEKVECVEDAARVAGVDLAKFKVASWTIATTDGKSSKITLKMERLIPTGIDRGLDIVFDRFKNYSIPPKYESIDKQEGLLAVLGLYDIHVGKLAWSRETGGEDYDLKIAERRLSNAVDDLLDRASHRRIEKFVMVMGQDFFQIDNHNLSTTSGTVVDTDGRLAKVFETGVMAFTNAIEKAKSLGNVDVLWCPGNHDRSISYYACKVIEGRYHNDPKVHVNLGDLGTRKYMTWGTNLIGFTHGDLESAASLPGLMASEQRENWSKTTCREFLTGHLHQEKKWISKAVDTIDTVTIRTLFSLCCTDAWHHSRGFVKNRQAAEVLLYSPTQGFVGNEIVNARDG